VATFCLLHGQWHDGSCWEPLAGRLRARGHQAVAPDLPLDDPRTSYDDRARPALDALGGADDRIVVVGHSVSSGYAALVALRRPGSLLVHLCPRFGTFPVPPDAPAVFREGFPFPPANAADEMVWDRDAAVAAMYPRLPPDTARALAARLRASAPPVGEFPLAAHPDVPTALIYTTDDEFFEPAWERFVARELLGIEPIEMTGGHFPMVEDPAALADQLDRLARSM
jgi:pimeloyl-ACP methyl ester carboxylesterase